MSTKRRVDRLNSLLKEVISDVIHSKVKNPHVNKLVTVIRVDVSKDVRYAKVYVSVITEENEKQKTVDTLNQAAGFIAVNASKQVVLRFFPELRFILDDSADQHARIESLLEQVNEEKSQRDISENNDE